MWDFALKWWARTFAKSTRFFQRAFLFRFFVLIFYRKVRGARAWLRFPQRVSACYRQPESATYQAAAARGDDESQKVQRANLHHFRCCGRVMLSHGWVCCFEIKMFTSIPKTRERWAQAGEPKEHKEPKEHTGLMPLIVARQSSLSS